MADSHEHNDEPKLASLRPIATPENVSERRRLARPIIVIMLAIAGAWLLLRPASNQLDVYRTISDIEFADQALADCIRKTADAHEWNDVGHFTSLRCNHPTGGGIRKLDGIEHFVVLSDVNLAFNEITDVSPLAELPHLHAVELGHNHIPSLPQFASADSLVSLELSYNRLDSMAWLTSLRFPILEILAVAHNRIADAAPLASLENLRELNVRSNRIQDLTPVWQLGQLDMLDAGGNHVSDISRIDALPKLRRLFLDKNRISSIDSLRALENLEQLDIGYNPLNSISELSTLVRLRRLDLRHTGLRDLDKIFALGEIEHLDLSGNPELACAAIQQAVLEFGEEAVLFDQSCEMASSLR